MVVQLCIRARLEQRVSCLQLPVGGPADHPAGGASRALASPHAADEAPKAQRILQQPVVQAVCPGGQMVGSNYYELSTLFGGVARLVGSLLQRSSRRPSGAP